MKSTALLFLALVFTGCASAERRDVPPKGAKTCKIRYFDRSAAGLIRVGETAYMPADRAQKNLMKIKGLPGFTSDEIKTELICL